MSNFGKFLGTCFWSNLTKNRGKTRKCLFFLLYKCLNFCTKRFAYFIWQTTTFHYSTKVSSLSTFWRKAKTLSYLGFVLCSMNRPLLFPGIFCNKQNKTKSCYVYIHFYFVWFRSLLVVQVVNNFLFYTLQKNQREREKENTKRSFYIQL
jgi:hypothetical protein